MKHGLVVVAALAACSSHAGVSSQNLCIVTGDSVMVHALITASYINSVGRASSDDLYQFRCSISDKKCEGIRLHLTQVDHGDPLTMKDLSKVDAEVSMVGNVATIRWDPNTLKIDFDRGNVEFAEAGKTGPTEGHGETGCEVSRAP